jgi:type IV pilus assembly protein PilE
MEATAMKPIHSARNSHRFARSRRIFTAPPVRQKFCDGFSLLELTAALGIAALLATIAIPGYQRHLDAARRADGKTALLETAHQLERCWAQVFSYRIEDGCALAFPQPSLQSFYLVTAPQRERTAFVLEAAPQGVQERDAERCGVLTLTHRGERGSQGEIGADHGSCW